MSTAFTEILDSTSLESGSPPLKASERLYNYSEMVAAAAYFTLASIPIQLHCVGLENDSDGYNPSGIHEVKVHADDENYTKTTIVRTEKDIGAYSAESRFCRYEESGKLTELAVGRRPWEDAAICVLTDGTIITSGVHVKWNKDDPTKNDRFFTEYYSGPTLDSQTYLGQSPDGHKDSRLAVINDKIILWTRPQQRCFEGKIYSTKLDSIDELRGNKNKLGENVAQSVYDRCEPVGAGIFAEGTWGGPNGAVDIGGGWALLQCHVSRRIWESPKLQIIEQNQTPVSEIMEYEGFMILHHPATGEAYIFGSHVSERQFPAGGAKWPKVRRVAFPGGLHDVTVAPDGNITGKATVGLRDKDMYVIQWRTAAPLTEFMSSK